MRTLSNSPRIFKINRTFRIGQDVDFELRRVCDERKLHLSDYVDNALRATLGLPQTPLDPKGEPHDAAPSWLALEPYYKEMLRWWPEAGAYYDLEALITLATPRSGADGVPDRPRNLHTALRGMCRCGSRVDGVTPGRLGAVLRYWRGHWREGRAVQREGRTWGVVTRETW